MGSNRRYFWALPSGGKWEKKTVFMWICWMIWGRNTAWYPGPVVINISLGNINSCMVRGGRKLSPPQHGDTACGKGPFMAVTNVFFFLLMLNHHAFVLFELSIFLFGSFALLAGRNCPKGIIPESSLIPLRWVSTCLKVLRNVIIYLRSKNTWW